MSNYSWLGDDYRYIWYRDGPEAAELWIRETLRNRGKYLAQVAREASADLEGADYAIDQVLENAYKHGFPR